MKKIMILFSVFAILTLMGCKKCIEYDKQLSHSRVVVGKTVVIRSYYKCIKFEE